MELYIREIVRHLIRRDLELRGIFLDDNRKSKAELPGIVPTYADPSERLNAQNSSPKPITLVVGTRKATR
jgi:hypothetical protein